MTNTVLYYDIEFNEPIDIYNYFLPISLLKLGIEKNHIHEHLKNNPDKKFPRDALVNAGGHLLFYVEISDGDVDEYEDILLSQFISISDKLSKLVLQPSAYFRIVYKCITSRGQQFRKYRFRLTKRAKHISLLLSATLDKQNGFIQTAKTRSKIFDYNVFKIILNFAGEY